MRTGVALSLAVALATDLPAPRHGLVSLTVNFTGSPGSMTPLLLEALSSTVTSEAPLTTSRNGTLNDSPMPVWLALRAIE